MLRVGPGEYLISRSEAEYLGTVLNQGPAFVNSVVTNGPRRVHTEIVPIPRFR